MWVGLYHRICCTFLLMAVEGVAVLSSWYQASHHLVCHICLILFYVAETYKEQFQYRNLCINICRTPREVLKPKPLHLLRGPADVNASEKHVWSLLLHKNILLPINASKSPFFLDLRWHRRHVTCQCFENMAVNSVQHCFLCNNLNLSHIQQVGHSQKIRLLPNLLKCFSKISKFQLKKIVQNFFFTNQVLDPSVPVYLALWTACLHQMFSWVMYWQGVGGASCPAWFILPHPPPPAQNFRQNG